MSSGARRSAGREGLRLPLPLPSMAMAMAMVAAASVMPPPLAMLLLLPPGASGFGVRPALHKGSRQARAEGAVAWALPGPDPGPGDVHWGPVDGGHIARACRAALGGAVAAAALLFADPFAAVEGGALAHLPPGPPEAAQVRMFRPRAAAAASPDATVSDSAAAAAAAVPAAQRDTALDEAWRLVDKYYIDRTFGGQDWAKTRESYGARLGSRAGDDQVMKLATEMVASLGDKYSRVLDAGSYAKIQKFDLIGVGATLMPDASKKLIVGAPPIPGSAADKVGIRVGDFVTAVNGVPTEGRTAFDIIDQIGDDPNAKEVTMTIRTQGPNDLPGEGKVRDASMTRTFTQVKDPISFKITERRADGTNVGYIRINEFNSLVKPSLESAIKSLEKDGANAFVLDIRSNPGGAFQSAVEIAGLFLDSRIATSVVDSNQVELPFKTPSGKVLVPPSDPLVLWVDGGSASASEVLAGALRDNCRASIMGSKSFGKGLIQAVYGLNNGGGLVLTVAKYVTPAGTDIQGSGINPDVTGSAVPGSFLGPLVMSTDTSKVDFEQSKAMLSEPMCKVPTGI